MKMRQYSHWYSCYFHESTKVNMYNTNKQMTDTSIVLLFGKHYDYDITCFGTLKTMIRKTCITENVSHPRSTR